MNASEVIERYEDLAAVVARMLALARARRWALLPALDAECAELVAQLRAAPARALSAGESAQVRDLTARIRRDQAQLQALVQPQLEQLVRHLRAADAGR